MQLVKMAWRNIWRNSRRTGITIAAMTLAVLLMVLFTSLFEGFLVRMERSLVEIELGDVQIFAPSYRDRPSLFETIDAPDELLGELDRRGFRATPRLLAGGLVASGDAAAGASLYGIDLERDTTVSEIYNQIRDGVWLDEDDPAGVVIGARLAKTLNVGLDDELVVLSQAADGSMANALYTVRGVLKLVGETTDRAGIFMTDTAFRELLVMPVGAHKVTVRRPDGADFDTAVTQVKELAAELDVKSWRELNPTLATYIDSTRGIFFVFYIVFYFAVAILLLNSMLMAVFERIREFGVLKAVGVGPGRGFRLILLESAFQTVLALMVAGVLLASPRSGTSTGRGSTWAMMGGGFTIAGVVFDPLWRPSVTASLCLTGGDPAGDCFLRAVLYPALKAARSDPSRPSSYQ